MIGQVWVAVVRWCCGAVVLWCGGAVVVMTRLRVFHDARRRPLLLIAQTSNFISVQRSFLLDS